MSAGEIPDGKSDGYCLLNSAFDKTLIKLKMFKNYFRTAFIYFLNQKTFTLINLAGLVIGMMVCFLSMLYINFELSYDRYNSKAERIFRLVTDVKTSNGIEYRGTSAPMAPAMLAMFPEVELATRIGLDYYLVQTEENHINNYEEKIAYADSSLFSVFDFHFVSGNQKRALKEPFSVVLSESLARKYFGNENPLNKVLILDREIRVTVTGVMEDMPQNSHFRVDILMSLSTLIESWWSREMANSWTRFMFHTYLVLPEGYPSSQLEDKLVTLANSHFSQEESKYILALEPLEDVYLYGKPRSYRSGNISTGNINNLYFFAMVAAFVLVAACFNFANLTTALSMKRTREIGVRKVLGATRSQLRYQFLLDTLLLSIIAFLIALLFTSLLLPFFSQLSAKEMTTSILDYLKYIGILALLTVFVGIVSGLYPAFILSNHEAISTLKGRPVSSNRMPLKKILVVAQFVISFFLITSTIVVYDQLDFMKNKQLGFTKEHKLAIDFHFDSEIQKNLSSIKHELASLEGIEQVSVSSCVPGRPNHVLLAMLENSEGTMQDFQMDFYFVDFNFLDQYDIEVTGGRKFSDQFSYDSTESMIINETALKALGYHDPDAIIGKRFSQGGTEGHIVGVVKDFHFNSLQKQIRPLAFRFGKMFTYMTLTVSGERTQNTIKKIEQKWPGLASKMPLSYFFVAEEYDALYKSEDQFGKLFVCFAILAIVISSLGLLGLSSFTIERRTKEIGIRKVLGSSTSMIIVILLKDLLVLIMIAFVISAPAAWYSADKWLSNFPYRISFSWWFFIIASLTVITLSILTVGLQTVRAAFENPVKSLKGD
jgi:putative ABC transport system permease protein